MVTRREGVHLELEDDVTAGLLRIAAAAELADNRVKAIGSGFGPKMRSSAADVDKTTRSLHNFESEARRAERQSSLLADTAIVLAPAFGGVASLAVPALAGITAQLGFAVAGIGTAVLAVTGMKDAFKALDSYNLDPTAQNLQKLNEAMEKLGPAGQHFVRELDALEPRLKQLKVAAENGLLPGAEAGIEHLLTLLPQVRGIIGEVSGTMGDLVEDAGKGLAGDRFKDFFDYLERDARPILTDLGHTVGDLTAGMAGLFVAFEPSELSFSSFLAKTAADFSKWAEGLDQTEGFHSFLDYLDKTGPEVADALGSIAEAFVAITRAGAPLSGPTLRALTTLADIVGKIAASPIGTPLVTLATGIALINRALATQALAKDSLVADLLLGKRDNQGQRGATAIQRVRTQVQGLTADIRAANSLPAIKRSFGIPTEEELTRQAAAAGRLRERAVSLGKGAAAVAGLTLVTTDLADKTGLANTASGALLGTVGGGYGAAFGAAIGAVRDLAAVNDDLVSATKAANLGLDNSTLSLQQLLAMRRRVADQYSDLNDLSGLEIANPFKTWPAIMSEISGANGRARDSYDALSGAITDTEAKAQGASGIGSLLSQGISPGLHQIGLDFDGATAASKAFFDTLNRANASLNLRAALRAQAQAIIDFQKALKQNPERPGKQDNINRNAALDAYAQASLNAVSMTKSPVVQIQRLADARKQFVALAESMKVPTARANELADQFGLVDRRASKAGDGAKRGMKKTQDSVDDASNSVHGFGEYFASLDGQSSEVRVRARTGQAVPLLKNVHDLVFGLDRTANPKVRAEVGRSPQRLQGMVNLLGQIKSKDISITTHYNHTGSPSPGTFGGGGGGGQGGGGSWRTGGRLSGEGTWTSDSIPIWASNGEGIIKAATMDYYDRKFGPMWFDDLNAGRFASGGRVKRHPKKQPHVKLNSFLAHSAGISDEELQAQDQIAQDQAQIESLMDQLNEQRLVGKKGHKHYVYASVGAARVALEADLRVAVRQLAADKAALAAGTYAGGPNDPDRLPTSDSGSDSSSTNDVASQLADNAAQLAGYADLFGRGTSAFSAERSVERALRDISAYGTAFAALKSAGAGPGILNQIKNRGDSGDFVGATRLANSLLANPTILGTINTELNAVQQLTGQIAAMTNPAGGFTGTGVMSPWQLNIGADPSQWMQEFQRYISHMIDAKFSTATG